jgi:hypothetical protein
VSAAEDFDQIRLQFVDPLQYAYELIRPIVLFGETAAERSRQTGVDRTVIGDKARRFVTDGMSALADGRTQPASGEGPIYPEAIAGYILYLKQLYPPSTCVRSSASWHANSATRPITTPSNGFLSPMRHPCSSNST